MQTIKRIPPEESHPRYSEWYMASVQLMKASRKLEALGHLPEGSPELMEANSYWRTARTAYESICGKICARRG